MAGFDAGCVAGGEDGGEFGGSFRIQEFFLGGADFGVGFFFFAEGAGGGEVDDFAAVAVGGNEVGIAGFQERGETIPVAELFVGSGDGERNEFVRSFASVDDGAGTVDGFVDATLSISSGVTS